MKPLKISCPIAVLLAISPALCQGQTTPRFVISTFAGNGTAGTSGDGGPATDAQLNYPMGIAFDRSGNLYIADQFNFRIRKVAPDRTITTVAGKSTGGFSGDGSAATNAELFNPSGIAVDSSGNLFIADTRNNRIRKVTSGGTITTAAGNGSSGLSGDGDTATNATLNVPLALAVDASGNVYIADAFNSVVRKLATDGKISTAAGTGTAGASGDDGSATSARLNNPGGLAVDGAGNLYIADTHNHRIRKVAPDGIITNVAGNGSRGFGGDGGPATEAFLNYPQGLALDAAGNLYIADSANSRIRVVLPDGTMATVAGNGTFGDFGDSGPATSAQLRFPHGLALDGAGNLYIADNQNSRIRVLTPAPPTNHSPDVLISGVIANAAFGALNSVAPGAWIEIYGQNLGSTSRQWAASDFNGAQPPIWLDGTQVTIGGRAAVIAYISPGQLNVQVPDGIAPGVQNVAVRTPRGTSAPYPVTVETTQPALQAAVNR